MLLAILILLLVAAAEAAPAVSFPLNSQVPPVARVLQPFDFQFSSETFTAGSGAVEYSLAGSPAWLSLDSPNRRLYGTPTAKDMGAPSFTIIAEDSTGSTAMQATLIVSADAAPKLNIDIADPLSQAGKLSGPQSLSLQPSKPFNIQFPPDTFTSSATAELTYYATLSDRSPLPSWVSFNPESMVFSGTSSDSPQTVDVMLVASDVVGFAGASLIFTLSVSAHQLVFSNVEQTVTVTAGSAVSVTDLRSQLSLDGQPLADSDFGNATATPPGWLSFDSTTLDMSGTAPPDVNSTSFAISVADRFGDVANTTVLLTTGSGLLRSAVGNLNAVVGESAKFVLSNVVTPQAGLQVEVDLGSAAQWLHFNETSLTIAGAIPSSATPQTIHGSIKVATADGSQSDTNSFDIVIKAAAATGSSGSSPRSTPAQSNASTTAEASETSSASLSPHHEPANNGAIIAVSVVCIVIAIIALVLGFLLYRRSKRPARPASPNRRKEDISRPTYPDELEWQMGDATFIRDRDVEKGEGSATRTETQVGSPSPLKKATRHNYRPSQTTSIGEADSQVLHSAIQSGDWTVAAGAIRSAPASHGAGAGPSSRPLEESPARGRRSRRSFRVHRDSQDSYGRRSVGLPARRRLHGIGHGRTSFGSPTRRFSSNPSRGADSYSSFSTLSTGMLSNGLLSPAASHFPAPPPSPCTTANRYSNTENRKSVRIVPGSPMADNTTILTDTRPLDERRQSYIRNRAVSRSPFFAAHGSSRASSSQRPSMIGTLADSRASGDGGEYAAGRTLSPSSYYGPRSTTAGEERPQFPGSLRRKRTGTGRTARAYSETSSAADTPSRRWRSTTNHGTIGPLAGNAPMESPRSSMVLSALSDSAYTTTEGTGTDEYNSHNAPSPADHGGGDPMDIDDPADLMQRSDDAGQGSASSSEGADAATRPPAFMTSPLSPSALRVKKQQQQPSSPTSPISPVSAAASFSKEHDPRHHHHREQARRTPSPTQSFKSNITTSPFHRSRKRSASAASAATTTSSSSSPTKQPPPPSPPPPLPTTTEFPTHYRPTNPNLTDFATPTATSRHRNRNNSHDDDDSDDDDDDDLNQAASVLLRNSAIASQQRRSSHSHSHSHSHGNDAFTGGSGAGGSSGGGGVTKSGLSAAVRQQLMQRNSIINRGRHHHAAMASGGLGSKSGGGGGRFGSSRAVSRESGGGGGGGGGLGGRREKEAQRRERRRRSGNGSGAGAGAGAGSRFSRELDRQRQRGREEAVATAAAVVGRDTGVGAEAPGEEEDDGEMRDPTNTGGAGGLRIPLSMISNVGAKTNFLLAAPPPPPPPPPPSSSASHRQSLLPLSPPPPPPSGSPSSSSSLPSSPRKKQQQQQQQQQQSQHTHHHLRPPTTTTTTNSGGMYGLGSSALGDDDRIFFVGDEGIKARRPVSVEGRPTRYSSVRGGISSYVQDENENNYEDDDEKMQRSAGMWKTMAVSTPSSPPPPPPPPIPEKSEERSGAKTRESSVVGNEAFL
ncbi:transmembrane glycoprotein [Diplodia corticola]|uniref:Transmembrane glycoprotein n=1 Tax=Diplodia corticola TaxID=236234 RepID=A0A1J9QX23_9PEZI|nr:transmembrane glycoprotein [Diplodia corticola]OJD33558.1 transmembrane glycoprotein [Diplodia corticola]